MIKVCHIITKLELGGAQQNTLYTIRHLNREHFTPLLITGSEGILIEEAERVTDVRKYYLSHFVREIRPSHDFIACYKIWRILRQEIRKDPHIPVIVHTHSSKAGIVGRWAAKFAGVSEIIHSIHGFGFHRDQSLFQRWLFIILEWLTSKITTHFIAVSSANIATGIHFTLFSPDQVSLIRSGIDIARFQQFAKQIHPDYQRHREEMLHELHIPQHMPIVGMVACFKPQKAPLDFVQAIKIVSEAFPDVYAIMVGDGILRPQIEDLISRYQLEHHISLLGWRNDIPKILPLLHLLVLTSRWEGLPRVCPQAMAAGLPIVATQVDGTPEAVHDGVNGFLLQPGDIEGIAEKILYLLNHPEVAEQMGQQGKQDVLEFDIHRMVQQQEELYQSLVGKEKQ